MEGITENTTFLKKILSLLTFEMPMMRIFYPEQKSYKDMSDSTFQNHGKILTLMQRSITCYIVLKND